MRLATNSLYSLASQVLPLFVSLATIPLFVTELGPARYGALAIIWVLLGYFGAADFGISRATAQRIASDTDGDDQRKAQAIWSAFLLVGAFGVVAGVVAWVAGVVYFGDAFEASDALTDELAVAAWLLVPNIILAAAAGVASGALLGSERFRLLAIGTVLSQTMSQIIPLAVAMASQETMADLLTGILAGRAIGALFLFAAVAKVFLLGHRISAVRAEMKGLLKYGSWVMVSSLVSPFMVTADRIVIGAVLGAVAVAAYAIPFQVAYRTLALPIALSQALFPRLAASDDEGASRLNRDFAVFTALSFTPVIAGLIVLSGPLLKLWLGAALDPRSIIVGQILLAGFWINAVAQVPFNYLQARGNTRFTGILHLAELPLYLLLLAGLGYEFGLAGFATAFALRCLIDAAALFVRSGLIDNGTMSRLALPAMVVAVALAIATGLELSAFASFTLAAMVVGASAVTAWTFMPDLLRSQIKQLVRSKA
ncbi:Membrane protein involved in the export of O-antigen and teichoic acid [Altererythrobacter epoxidivorans]|uniref:Membrane protein involved in the export of O-antigen and teichoic acid n=1 Tax=Altererythrobacter epoxidivorans TaxID=361183 RepID=A0A0M5L4K8_9SPHN|nr:oligosaccharide flippase family protein [Altererythrobacter epoxidivorans]ALE15487.1 Membrane protein involved in the export of O-antigen and teichoic acid [Altererythrobacter epoxidivorans]